MPSKKVIAGLIGIFMVVSVVALIPVFMYGFTVNVAEIEMSIGLSSSGGTSSPSSDSFYTSSSIELQQTPTYDLSSFNAVANEKTINAYEYVFLGDHVETSEESSGGTEIVKISITFNLTTPSGNSLLFSFSPQGLKGQGLKNVMILLGPDEINRETGTFHLTLTISIIVTLPYPLEDTEILNLELTPVALTFVILA